MRKIDIFQEDIEYWSQQYLSKDGKELYSKPYGWVMGKRIAIDKYRRYGRREVPNTSRGSEGLGVNGGASEKDKDPYREKEALETDSGILNHREPSQDSIVMFRELFDMILKIASGNEKWVAYLGYTIRMNGLEQFLREDQLRIVEESCPTDDCPSKDYELAVLLGFKVDHRRRTRGFTTMKKEFWEELESNGINIDL